MSYFVCKNCGFGSASWYGKCPDCGKWNALTEKPHYAKTSLGKTRKESLKKISVTPLKKIKTQVKSRIKTGLFEFDRVLGGGFIPGEVILLTGQPGIGKSTLILQALKNIKTLYISGEESAEQVKNRADRLKVDLDNFLFSNDLQVEGIIETASEMKDQIDMIVIDSIQTVYSKDIEGAASSISQLKETTKLLVNFAKRNSVAIILIGHITKEGEVAGPKSLEHFVDAVLNFEGEKVSNYRLIRASKNRFGGIDQIGIFEMSSNGLKEIDNPLIFLEEKKFFEPGKAIVGVAEGQRPLFFEIQTLAVPTVLPVPRRVVRGFDYNKALLLLAVIRKNLNINMDNYDIYINVVGGVSIKGTSADLGLIAALVSSFKNIPLSPSALFIGEVGLLGEIRKTYSEEKILSEGRRLGFNKIFSSKNFKNVKDLKKII